MTYEPPKYPDAIPDLTDLPDRTDDVDWVNAARLNELKKELRAIMIELGTNPSGEYDTVKAFLEALAAAAGVPAGVIVIWSGLIANIPTGWALCDGGDGRPDLREKFIKGAADSIEPGGTGGAKTHLHAVDGHAHSVSITSGVNSAPGYVGAEPEDISVAKHTHTHPVTGNTGEASPSTDSKNHEPEFYEVLYIIKT